MPKLYVIISANHIWQVASTIFRCENISKWSITFLAVQTYVWSYEQLFFLKSTFDLRQPVTWPQTTSHMTSDYQSHDLRLSVTWPQTTSHMISDYQSFSGQKQVVASITLAFVEDIHLKMFTNPVNHRKAKLFLVWLGVESYGWDVWRSSTIRIELPGEKTLLGLKVTLLLEGIVHQTLNCSTTMRWLSEILRYTCMQTVCLARVDHH